MNLSRYVGELGRTTDAGRGGFAGVFSYAEGIEVNVEGIQQRVEEQMRGIDPAQLGDPEAMQQLLDGGMFEMPETPAQKAALSRLETTLALVEGARARRVTSNLELEVN